MNRVKLLIVLLLFALILAACGGANIETSPFTSEIEKGLSTYRNNETFTDTVIVNRRITAHSPISGGCVKPFSIINVRIKLANAISTVYEGSLDIDVEVIPDSNADKVKFKLTTELEKGINAQTEEAVLGINQPLVKSFTITIGGEKFRSEPIPFVTYTKLDHTTEGSLYCVEFTTPIGRVQFDKEHG